MIYAIERDREFLSRPTELIDFSNPPFDPKGFSEDLLETMYHYKGIGLAANQCSYLYSCFVMWEHPADLAFFNPRIVHFGTEMVVMEEGCLSFPDLTIKIKRPYEIRVRFANYLGEVSTKAFAGNQARVIQHEIDHLNGVLFYNRANRFHRDQAFRRRKNK